MPKTEITYEIVQQIGISVSLISLSGITVSRSLTSVIGARTMRRLVREFLLISKNIILSRLTLRTATSLLSTSN